MKKRFSGPQIVAKLRQADKLLGQGKTVEEVCKEIDVTDATYYRWRQKYGGMSPDMVRQLRPVRNETLYKWRVLRTGVFQVKFKLTQGVPGEIIWLR